MDKFAALSAFVAVAEERGFAPAARRAGVATSSVTRQVDNLEECLGVQLLNRSTRKVTLTPAGETYFEYAIDLLQKLEEADRVVSEAEGPIRGTLRLSLPVAFSRLHVAPAIPQFLSLYPEVDLDLTTTDNIVNLVDDRIDIAIRLGVLESSSLISRKLAPHRRVVCASPGYLESCGTPNSPEDLDVHECLLFNYTDGEQTWLFSKGKMSKSIEPKGSLRANHSETLREAAVGGAGIIMMPTWLVGQDLCRGNLVELLTDWTVDHRPGDSGIYAIYLPNRRGSKKVRAFLDFLKHRFGDPPYWDLSEDTQILTS